MCVLRAGHTAPDTDTSKDGKLHSQTEASDRFTTPGCERTFRVRELALAKRERESGKGVFPFCESAFSAFSRACVLKSGVSD